MTIDMRRIRTGWMSAGVLVALLCGLAGCGGSGSSGFDVVPSEAQAIGHVIDSGDCTEVGAQTFCASGAQSTGAFAGALVKIAPQQAPLVCDDVPISEKCTASLAFTTEGFEQPTSLFAAVSETEDGPWNVVPVTVTEHVGGPSVVSIDVPGRTDVMAPTPVIAAVLVFDGDAPVELPPTAAHLADFGVELVYVSQRLEIIVPH